MSNITKHEIIDDCDLNIHSSLAKPRLYLIIKRLLDLVFSALGILLFFPILIVIALLIKLDSPGPVLFKQKRIGLGGKEFNIYKFRTMKINLDELAEEMVIYKVDKDPRITSVGRLLRKTSLDELPQLFSVLIGDMSLVGPRPSFPFELEMSQKYMQIFKSTKPGITGIWQLSQKTSDDMLSSDLEYIQKVGFFTDLKILFKTIQVVLFAKGGY